MRRQPAQMHGNERVSALIVVLIAILVMLPPTLILAKMAFRWQRQSLVFRDTVDEEFVAHAGFEEARNRLAADGMDLEPNEGRSFRIRGFESHTTSARVAREEDIVLSQDGLVFTGTAASEADLEVAGTDAEGRFVYRYRKLEIYVVRIDVSRRPTLPAIRLYGVIARLPDNTFETLGVTVKRGYFD